VDDLAVIVVSTDQARWLPRCLPTVLERAGGLSLDVVVVDNGSTRDTRELVERDFPDVRVLVVPNRGFAHANNEALRTVTSRYVLFLNPDTELLEGTLADVVAELERRPEIGLAGVRQVTADGSLVPTMRRYPTVARALGDALGLERLNGRAPALGERELRLDRYDREFEGDWTIGSFMLSPRAVLDEVGGFDDSFFLYSEEVDLCLRVRRTGRRIVHLPAMTILHHGSAARVLEPRMAQQNAYAQLQFARKHFRPLPRAAYRGALLARYGLRSLPVVAPRQRAAARAAAALVLGRARPPFEDVA
jgi:N-acetylglucosaminyl-diphospho-decaprenol L-rhamnosyltransferase